MADYSISAELELDTSGYQSGIKNAEKTTKSFSDKIKETIEKVGNNGLTKSMANLTLAVGGVKTAMNGISKVIKDVTKAVKECSDAYKTQYKAEVQLETAAQNNPFLNSSSVQQLKEYASEMQRISTMGDEQILPYMAQLAAAGRTQEQIQKIVKTALDVSASGAMSFESAVKNLNKTYSGLAGEIGESIPDIKTLTAEQLKNGDAIDLVAVKYAGLAEATAKATGSTEQLKNAWGDFKENIGRGFEEALTPVRNWLTGIISDLNEAIAKKDKLAGAQEAQKQGNADLEQYNLLLSEQVEKISQLEASYSDISDGFYEAGLSRDEANAKVDKMIEKERQLLRAYSARIDYLKAVEEYNAKQAEAEAQRAEEEAQRLATEAEINKIAADAKATYAETLANFEKEVEWREALGEEISREQYLQEKLNVVKQAFLKMMQDGQGYITENNQGYKDAVALVESITEELERMGDAGNKALTPAQQYAMAMQDAEKHAKAIANAQEKAVGSAEVTKDTAEEEVSTYEKLKKVLKEVASVMSTIADVARASFKVFTNLINFSIDDAEESLLEFEDKVLTFFKYTVPKLPEFIKKAMDSIIKLIQTKGVSGLNGFVDTAISIADTVLKRLSEWIESGGFQYFVSGIMNGLVKSLLFIIDNLDEIIVIAVQMATTIVAEVIKHLPEILVALVKAIPAIIIELIKQIPSIIVELAKAIGEMMVNAVTSVGDVISSGWKKFTSWLGFATGVNNAPRGLALVGEQGPELIDFKGGERVYTANNTKALLGGTNSGGNSFNVTFNNVSDTSASAMMRQLRRYNRELAINGVI